MHYDFAVLSFNHAAEVDDGKKNLYARQLCILIHEALEDIPAVFGGDFRKDILSMPNGVTHLSLISGVLKTLSGLRKMDQASLSDIRNFVAAHRDHDALRQLEVMRRIDTRWLLALSTVFVEFLGNMAKALIPLLTEMGNPRVVIGHLLKK